MQRRIIVIFNILWTLFLAFNAYILFSSPDGFEAVGYLMIFASFPSSIILIKTALFFRLPYLGELIVLAILGYMQWNLVGYLVGLILKFLISTFKKFRY